MMGSPRLPSGRAPIRKSPRCRPRAVIEAAIDVQQKHGDWNIVPEIMIPLVGEVKELAYVKDVGRRHRQEGHRRDAGIEHEVRGRHHDRDPARRPDRRRDRQGGRVLLLRHQRPDPDDLRLLPRRRRQVPRAAYYDKKIYESDPFAQPGSERRRQAGRRWPPSWASRPARTSTWASAASTAAIRTSVEFCHKVGLNYVSCSPFRVPIARLAAAQAAILEKQGQL